MSLRICFLNCNNRKISDYLNNYFEYQKYDLIILSEANHIQSIRGFEYFFCSPYKYGLHVFSVKNFDVEAVSYTIEEINKHINPELHRDRILNIKLSDGILITAVHIDYGWYNPFAMNKLFDNITKVEPNIIVGDFNSGYIDDSLDEGGILFQNGILHFRNYENLGYVDPLKGSHEFSHVNNRSKRRFRLDHCFGLLNTCNVNHIDYFLEENITDHKGLDIIYKEYND